MQQAVRRVASPVAILTFLGLVSGVPFALAEEPVVEAARAVRVRQPVALYLTGDLLLVANSRSGSITVIEPTSGSIVTEHVVAKRIADMVGLDKDGNVLVLDNASGSLLKATLGRRTSSVQKIASVPSSTSKMAIALDCHLLFITAKWSRQVLSITLDDGLERAVQQVSITLPFAPQEVALVNGNQTLLVADAFGGRIAVVDAVRMRLLKVRSLHGHNIRGLAVSADGKELYIAHQRMTDRALADFEELHWGRMVTNAVHVLQIDAVLHGESRHIREGWLDSHGVIGSATGDPGRVVIRPDGLMAVAFSGVGEIVVRSDKYVRRIAVQGHPEAMAIEQDRLYVANRFSDSVSIIDLKHGALVENISLGPTPELTAVERGEQLFFDARLSHDGWMSCHSCHTDGHSAGLLVDTLGDGDYGAPKRVPSLLGTRDTGPWGWTASAATLADQVRKSVATTMHHDGLLTETREADLVAYLESLEAPPSSYSSDRELVSHGQALFEALGCMDCHTPPRFTSRRRFKVGLADEHDRLSFNPPSLLGVGQRDRLFHDGRAESLEDVLRRFRHQLDSPLSPKKLAALLAYLRSL